MVSFKKDIEKNDKRSLLSIEQAHFSLFSIVNFNCTNSLLISFYRMIRRGREIIKRRKLMCNIAS